jgi:hypothetical protein
MSKAKTITSTTPSVVPIDETAVRRERARLRKQKQRERDRHQQLMVIEQAPNSVTCHAVTPALTPSKIRPSVTTEAVTASPGGWWNAAGRGIVGIMLIAVGVTIAVTSMEANSWYGYSLATDAAAGDIFSRLSVLAEVVACVLPTANRFYWQDGDRWTAMKGTAMMVVALMVVGLACSGFVITNVSNAVDARAERTTPTVMTAQRALDDARAARDRECVKVGPVCRQREDAVAERQNKLDEAKAEVRAQADPQAESFHVTPNTLRTAKAGAMVLMCLAAGYIISLGWGLVFGRRRTTAAASAQR